LDRDGDFVLVVAVPPFMLETARVYSAWDRIGEPAGRAVSGTAIPPGIRRYGPLVNDLYPAATSIETDLDDWRVELESRWERPVLMSGSGPSLYAFFPDQAEADEGLALVPEEARDAFMALPQARGAHLVEDG
jgi:4-diphosphocytidyl-2C-methyl-D-erythritol kinase